MAYQPEFGPRTAEAIGTLSIEEKAALTAGSGFFTFGGAPSLGISGWGSTDGPNGARGASMLGSGESKATCLPCGSALGASWDPALVERLGEVIGRETRTKASRVLLAPTVNLHRSPLAGRNFECFSEDPLLTGVLAAAYIRGAQSQGVATTVKHFIGNESETNRYDSNSLIDERTLRELYLVPFEYAVRLGGTLGIMTSYNRLNGEYCNDLSWLLTDVLRGEWGFEGFVVTDWFAVADTVSAANAGLDIEMPAGDRAYGSKLAAAVADGRVPESALDLLAGRMLTVFERLNAWSDEPVPEQSIDVPEHRVVAREASAGSMVLLRNEPVDGAAVLPLDVPGIRSIAVLGPNAARAQIMGGGSATLRPFHRTSPLDALRARLGGTVEITYSEGCNLDKTPPLLAGAEIISARGEQGFDVEVFGNASFEGAPLGVTTRDTSRIIFMDEALPGVKLDEMSARARATLTASVTGPHRFEIRQVSHSRVFVDGALVLDGITAPPPLDGRSFFGFGARPVQAVVDLVSGQRYEITIEMVCEPGSMMRAVDLRVARPQAGDPIGDAVAAAAAADVAIVVVGTNDEWETEGEDRQSMALPGGQDALVAAVVAANPRTIVVVNSGAPVAMPWAGDVPAVVQSWFGGQEMADALVDVLTGVCDPGGRLPTTFPQRIEHTPSFGDFPGDNGKVRYAEGVFMGYRWYGSRHLPVLFPFGHGLSYTTFNVGAPVVSALSAAAGDTITVEVPVTNTGTRPGSHVVQCYVRPHQSALARPERELKGFAKVALSPGESTTVTLTLDSRAFAYYDAGQPEWPALRERLERAVPMMNTAPRRTEAGWVVDAGGYDIVIANSATDEIASVTIELI